MPCVTNDLDVSPLKKCVGSSCSKNWDVKNLLYIVGVAREMVRSMVEHGKKVRRLLRLVLSSRGNVLVLVLGLQTDDHTLECLESKHGGHGGRNGSNEVGAHAAVEGSPALFV